MLHWVNAHGLEMLLGSWLFSAAASTMPQLPENAAYGWRWLYGFFHFAAANLDKLKEAIEPPIK
jgi:hypothetical protein